MSTTVSIGEVAGLLADTNSVAANLRAGTQNGADMAAAANAAATVAAAIASNPLTVALAATAIGGQLAAELARLEMAVSGGNTDAIVDATLGIVSITGAIVATVPSPQTKAVGVAISTAATAAKELYKGRQSIADALRDMMDVTDPQRTPFVWVTPQEAIDRGLIDPKTLLPRPISNSIGTTPDPLVKVIRYVDPLILDLDGDGLEITPLAAGVLFDANGDTVRTGTAWARADDGILVWDRNGNGSIDSGRELFGDETVLANGQKAAHGFAALSELDQGGVVNGVTLGAADGIFDSKDARYAELRIWRDLNQDGISQAAELKSLADSGVQGIALSSAATNTNYGDAILSHSGTFTRMNGGTGQAGSFILAQNNFVREFTPIVVSDAAKALPGLQGSGWVRDLQEAATQSPQLVARFNQVKGAPTSAAYKVEVANLLRDWGNLSGYNSASKQALSAGYGLILSDPLDDQERGWMEKAIKAAEADRNAYRGTLSAADRAKFDAMRERMVGGLEKIHAYEAFTGHTFLNWSQIRGDAENYVPRWTAGGGRVPVEVWVPLSQIIYENRNAFMSTQSGYLRVAIPAPPSGTPHIEALWQRITDDAVSNLMPGVRLAKYLDEVSLVVNAGGMTFDFSQMNATLAAQSTLNKYEGAITTWELYRAHGQMLDALGWDGAARIRALLEQAAIDSVVHAAFDAINVGIFGSSATAGSEAGDAFIGDAGSNVFAAGSGNDWVYGQGGDDNLSGNAGDDVLVGGEGSDLLQGDDGADSLNGDAGDDFLQGGRGNDTMDGGAGNDILAGGRYDTWNGYYDGWGNDTYQFGRGDGQDTIVDDDAVAGNVDKIVFKAGVAVADVSAVREGDALILKIAGTTDQVRIDNYFVNDGVNNRVIEEVRFTDSAAMVWRLADIKARVLVGTAGNDTLIGYATADTFSGADGNDILYGRDGVDLLSGGNGDDSLLGDNGDDVLNGDAGNDVLQGGTGNDTLNGGAGNDILAGGRYDTWNGYYDGWGNDTYQFGRGDGQDIIIDDDATAGNIDKIVFKLGVAVADVRVVREGDALLLQIAGTTDQMRIDSFFVNDGVNNRAIEEVRFSDSPTTVWRLADIKAKAVLGTAGSETLIGYATADTIHGWDGNDTLYGRDGADHLTGGNGDDFLVGENGDDTLIGDAGTDVLQGGVGNDTLNGGAGNDILAGGIYDTWNGYYHGWGNDIYQFGRGDGQDTIIDDDATAGNVDKIVFKAGVAVADVSTVREGDALILKIAGTTDQVRIDSYFVNDGVNNRAIEEVRFSDSPTTVWRLADIKAKAVLGTAGSETLIGYATADTIHGWDGNDTLYGRDGADYLTGGNGDDFLVGENGDDTLIGDAGNDVLQGGTGNDTLNGGAGNDILAGGIYDTWNGHYHGWGNDTYQFGRGDGQDTVIDDDATAGNVDKIVFKAGVAAADVRVVREGDALLLQIAGTTDQMRIDSFFVNDGVNKRAIEEVRFSDSPTTVWRLADIKAMVLNGGAGHDTIVGYATADTLNGNDGNDSLQGAAGNDLLYGDAGNDVLDGGHGDDTVYGGSGSDTLIASPGYDVLFGGSEADVYQVDLSAASSAELYAGTGDQLRITGASKAQLRFRRVDKQHYGDVPEEFYWRETPNTWVEISRAGTGGFVYAQLLNEDGSASGQFSSITVDGVALSHDEIRAALDSPGGGRPLFGYSTNDTIAGGAGNDWIDGGGGIDVLSGNDGNDRITGAGTLDGGAGDDGLVGSGVLMGGSGNDALERNSLTGHSTLLGGDGNDTLTVAGGYGAASTSTTLDGGRGSDTYNLHRDNAETVVYRAGDGNDVIHRASSEDVVRLDGLKLSDLMFARAGNALLIAPTQGTGSDLLTLQGYFSSAVPAIHVLADGGGGQVAVSSSAIGQLANLGNALNNQITGTAGADTLDAQGGHDYVQGMGGNDLLRGGDGDDHLTGGDGNDSIYGDAGVDRVFGGSGDDHLEGGAGDDRLEGGTGSDRMVGGAGNDFYAQLSLGNSGAIDEIVNNDVGATSFDTIDLGSNGATPYNTWFRRNGDDLTISLLGNSDKLVVKNWFGDSANRVEQMLSDGWVPDARPDEWWTAAIGDGGVHTLVQAMTGFAPVAGQTSFTDAALLQSISQAWTMTVEQSNTSSMISAMAAFDDNAAVEHRPMRNMSWRNAHYLAADGTVWDLAAIKSKATATATAGSQYTTDWINTEALSGSTGVEVQAQPMIQALATFDSGAAESTAYMRNHQWRQEDLLVNAV